MAITIPYASSFGITVGKAGRGAAYLSETTFMTPGQAAGPGALNQLAGGLNKLDGALQAKLLEDQRLRNVADLLADKVAYEDALRVFESEYKKKNQGADARAAEEDFDAFHQERLEILQNKWGGNPYLMESVAYMAEEVRAPSMNRAAAYRDQQEEIYKDAQLKADWRQTLVQLADPSLSYADRAKALKVSEAELRKFAGQRAVRGEDGKIGWEGGRNVDAEIQRRD